MTLRIPRRFVSAAVAYAFLASLASPILRADTVVLTNGDRLTGTAVKLEGGKLTFKTAYSDAIIITWDQVGSLKTSQPIILPTQKGYLSVTSIERTPAGLNVLTDSGPSTMAPAAVTVLRTPADQKAYEASLHPGWGHAWAGTANLSLALTRGNSDVTTFGAGLTAARATSTDKTSLYANTVYGRDAHAVPATSANATGGGLRYDHNLKPKIFVYGSGDFFFDALQDLDLRSIVGGGFGWHAAKSPRQTFDLLGGGVWTHENYSATALAQATTNSFGALSIGELYTRKMGAASQLTEQAQFYPDLSDTSQYQFVVNSSFTTKIGKLFNWVTTFNDSYTSFPPAGTQNNDAILTTGLGLTLTRH